MRGSLGNGSIVCQFLEKCKQRRERLDTERTEVEHRGRGEEYSEESLCYKLRISCRLEAGATCAWPLLGVCVFGADVVGQGERFGDLGGAEIVSDTEFGKSGQDGFGGDVADEVVAGERATAEAGHCGVEAAAARCVGGVDFFLGGVGAGMEVDSEFDSGDVGLHLGIDAVDEIGGGGAYRVCERD